MMKIERLENLGYRELNIVRDILDAWLDDGLPDDFYDDFDDIILDIDVCGNVSLTNSEGQVARLNGDELESWYFTPNQGVQGFRQNLIESVESGEIDNYEDIKYVLEICENAYDDDGIIVCTRALIFDDLRTDVEGIEVPIEELDEILSNMELSIIEDTWTDTHTQKRIYQHDEYDDIEFEVYIFTDDIDKNDDTEYEVVSVDVA